MYFTTLIIHNKVTIFFLFYFILKLPHVAEWGAPYHRLMGRIMDFLADLRDTCTANWRLA